MSKFTDDTAMPFGKHIGKKLINVPADYLIYLYDNDLKPGPLRSYIADNMDALRKEIKESNFNKYQKINRK